MDNNDDGSDRCGHCGNLDTTQTLQLCTGCRQRAYCGQSCQLAAWRAGHKKECKLLKADAETKKIAASIRAAENEADEPNGGISLNLANFNINGFFQRTRTEMTRMYYCSPGNM